MFVSGKGDGKLGYPLTRTDDSRPVIVDLPPPSNKFLGRKHPQLWTSLLSADILKVIPDRI